MNTHTPSNILVMRGGALGDFVLTLPALAALRTRYPGAAVELRTRPRHAVLAQAPGLCDRSADIDAAAMAAAFVPETVMPRELADYFRAFDLVVSYLADADRILQSNLAAAGVRRMISIAPRPTDGHAMDVWRAPFMAGLMEAEPQLPLPRETLLPGQRLLNNLTGGRAAALLHPGSGSRKKNWPAARYMELAEALSQSGLQPVFLLGEAEPDIAPLIGRRWPALIDAGLIKLAGVISAGRVYIGNDSGVSHLAALLGTPTVALFGPTDPAVWRPRGRKVTVLRSSAADGAMPAIPTQSVLAAALYAAAD